MAVEQDQQTLEDAAVKDHSDAQEAEVTQAPEPKKEAPKSVLTDEDKRDLTLAIRTTESSVLNPVMYEQSKLIARDFFESGALPKHLQNPTQAFVTIITGAEMGLKPMESIQSLYIINGIITLWGKAVPKALKRHNFKFKFLDEDQDHCHVVVWKGTGMNKPADDDEQYEDTFYFKDAVDSGYTVDNYGKIKVGWKPGQNRKLKMRYNVLSALIKTYIPEVLGEAADVAEVAQDYIDAEATTTTTPATAQEGIRHALKKRQEEGSTTSAKAAPKAVEQEQGEDEDV
jgi:hypothetical protein